jgi:hypothetical protein
MLTNLEQLVESGVITSEIANKLTENQKNALSTLWDNISVIDSMVIDSLVNDPLVSEGGASIFERMQKMGKQSTDVSSTVQVEMVTTILKMIIQEYFKKYEIKKSRGFSSISDIITEQGEAINQQSTTVMQFFLVPATQLVNKLVNMASKVADAIKSTMPPLPANPLEIKLGQHYYVETRQVKIERMQHVLPVLQQLMTTATQERSLAHPSGVGMFGGANVTSNTAGAAGTPEKAADAATLASPR